MPCKPESNKIPNSPGHSKDFLNYKNNQTYY